MKKRYILILVTIIPIVVTFGQTDSTKSNTLEKDSNDVIEITLNTNELNISLNEDIEKGCFEVKNIEDLLDFYLIFVERDSMIRTIYSKKNIIYKGIEIEVGGTYYFELACKDTLSNGICVPTIPDVTYFGKFKGYEIGKLTIAKNLYGLILEETSDR